MPNSRIALLAGACIAAVAVADDFTWLGGPLARNDEWSDPDHWDGQLNLYPSTRQDHAIIDGTTVSNPVLDIDVAIGAVTISGGGTLDTNGFQYSIFNSGGLSGDTIVGGAGSLLLIVDDPNNPTDAGSGFIINSGGTVRLDTAVPPVVSARSLDVNSGGLFEGAGTLDQLGRTGPVSIDGTLRVTGGTLTCNPWDSGVVFDWDGSSSHGTIEIKDDSSLVFAMPVEPQFDGIIELGDSAMLDVQNTWSLSGNAVLRVFSAPATPATISGSSLTINGTVDLATGSLVLNAPTTVSPGATILLLAGKFLRFDRPATIDSPSVFFPSTTRGTLIVRNDVTIGSGTGAFDMDGLAEDGAIEIDGSFSWLTIDVGQLDLSGDTFNGSLAINGGELDVTVADGEWEMAGDLLFSGSGGGDIRGGDRVRISGTVETAAYGYISTDVVFAPGSVVTLGSGHGLECQGPQTTLDGVTVTGAMSNLWLRSENVDVIGATTISSDEPVVLADDTTIDISAPFIISSGLQSWPSGPAIQGTTIIRAGGVLDVDDPNDQTQTVAGVLELHGTSDAGGAVLLRGERFSLQGPTNVSGLVIVESSIDLAGTLTFGANSGLTLRGGTTDEPNVVAASAVIPFNPLFPFISIEAPTLVEATASLGLGTGVYVQTDGELTLEAETDAGLQLANKGLLRLGEPGQPIGTVDAGSFLQFPTGTLVVRVGPGGASLLRVSQSVPLVPATATVDGELVVELEDGFVPGGGDLYTIITSDMNIGLFDTVTGPANMTVLYGATSVVLLFSDAGCNAADIAEPFGILDLADIGAFVAGFVGNEPIADLNSDGVFDLADIGLFVAAFTAGCP
ncbi:MAG: hypothetical protein H6810_05280 [Phycisphaeraceae bacterium]|nr:MAG: hypothetical protein H6810_05280 [Phycisphaeraceae bacterium]